MRTNMKNVILLHGYGDNPDCFWLPYIKRHAEGHGYKVWAPLLPNNMNPSLKEQLPYVLDNGTFTHETVVIAHSAGCPLTIALLEKLKIKIKQVILVAAFIEIKDEKLQPLKPMIQEHYDWSSIAEKVKDFIVINSDNDPWGCDETQARILFKHMGGTLMIRHGEGHMGSKVYNQPYKEFPLLAKLLD